MNKDNLKTKIKQFGDLQVGDQLIGSDGQPVTVTDVYEKHHPDKMYEIEMEDGQVIKASGNHLWYCETEIDKKNKNEYIRLAKVFFENNQIPNKINEDEALPLEVMINMFGDNISTKLFIEKACKTLGYSSYTPIVTQELMKSGNAEITNKKEIFNYSYNNLINFLKDMKNSLENEDGFMFGQVRTTEEIFDIAKRNVSINIPTVKELQERKGN